VSGEVTIKYH